MQTAQLTTSGRRRADRASQLPIFLTMILPPAFKLLDHTGVSCEPTEIDIEFVSTLPVSATTGPPATAPIPVYQVRVEGEGADAVVLVDITVNAAR